MPSFCKNFFTSSGVFSHCLLESRTSMKIFETIWGYDRIPYFQTHSYMQPLGSRCLAVIWFVMVSGSVRSGRFGLRDSDRKPTILIFTCFFLLFGKPHPDRLKLQRQKTHIQWSDDIWWMLLPHAVSRNIRKRLPFHIWMRRPAQIRLDPQSLPVLLSTLGVPGKLTVWSSPWPLSCSVPNDSGEWPNSAGQCSVSRSCSWPCTNTSHTP